MKVKAESESCWKDVKDYKTVSWNTCLNVIEIKVKRFLKMVRTQFKCERNMSIIKRMVLPMFN